MGVSRRLKYVPVEQTCPECNVMFTYQPHKPRDFKRVFCGQTCARRHTAKQLRQVRQIFICEYCHITFTDKTFAHPTRGRRFCSVRCRARWQAENDPLWRQKLSLNRANRPRGATHERFGKAPHHGKFIAVPRPDGTILMMRSRPERMVAAYLDWQGVHWLYEPRRFTLQDRTYCPDFWIDDWGCFWEVKGWFHAKHQETVRQFRACYPQIPLVVIPPAWYHWMDRQVQAAYREVR